MARWQVFSQVDATEQGAGGKLIRGKRVYYRLLDGGTESSVFVPENEYNAERVKQIVAAQAGHLAAVNELAGETS